MRDQPVKAWICTICGYIHYGDTPPAECPVCGADATMFEPYKIEEAQAAPVPAAEKAATVIIVGAGIAGVSAAEAVRKISADARIVLLSDESELPYYRLNLTRYLDGELKANDLPLHPLHWYEENRIDLRLDTSVIALDPGKKSITTEKGDTLVYDRLILANGAHSFKPPIPGAEQKNVYTLRTHPDADLILAAAQPGMNCVCIGGGILGLETAGALNHRGARVTVIEALQWLMPRQLNRKAAANFENRVRRMGIELITGVKIKELAGDGQVSGVLLEDGALHPADLVVISAGVRSNTDLARKSGLTVNQGIVVDDRMQTSDPNIYAAGDSAEHRGVLYGTWMPAQLQGSIAGMSAAGQQAAFPGVPRSNTLKVLGIELFSIGVITPETLDDHLVEEEKGGNYTCFILREKKIVGAILLGDTSPSASVRKAVEERMDFNDIYDEEISVQTILGFLRS